MPELKTKEPKPKTDPRPTCFANDSGSSGLTFQLKGGIRMFALHSFLMRIEMKSENEIWFHYTYGVVRVIGRKLGLIYTLTVSRVLGGVRPTDPDDPCRDEIEVTQIVFEDAKDASGDGP
jgi:hypothetical protein